MSDIIRKRTEKEIIEARNKKSLDIENLAFLEALKEWVAKSDHEVLKQLKGILEKK
jgi:hypothetical protein